MRVLRFLRRVAATRLARREAWVAAGRGGMIAYYCLAGVLDLVAGAALLGGLLVGGDVLGGPIMATVCVALVMSLLPLVSAAGLLAPAMSAEREEGTLEALVLTPMERRDLVWGKLLGRAAPLRRFLLAAAPAFVCCGEMVTLRASADIIPGAVSPGDKLLTYGLFGSLGLLGAALWWLLVMVEAHCVGAIALFFSAKCRRSWAASLATYGVAFALPVTVGCCSYGLMSLPFHLIVGPVLLAELVGRFDHYAIGGE